VGAVAGRIRRVGEADGVGVGPLSLSPDLLDWKRKAVIITTGSVCGDRGISRIAKEEVHSYIQFHFYSSWSG